EGKTNLVAWNASRWMAGCVEEDRAQVFDWCAEALCRLRGSLAARLKHLSMAPAKKTTDSDCVTVMTMHAAKGLEFPHVWIVACEEDLCPHAESELEEERRLFYVAMTRAEDHLVLSFCRDDAKPSRFIEEAGLSC